MKITQIRSATCLLEFESAGRQIGILVDPMLAPKGSIPILKYFGRQKQRNPLVDLPANTQDLLRRVTHGLVTHCQRGHFDHLDRAGKRFFRESGVPVICMPRDSAYLAARSIATQPLLGAHTQPFFHGQITSIPCVHGRGLIGLMMEHGHGYFIDLPGEPSVYIAGDTILTDEVKQCLTQRQPHVTILPAGGSQFDLGQKVNMDASEVLAACSLTSGMVVANHLEALDFCATSRAALSASAISAGLKDRLLIPQDGEALEFQL
jgi:L-ascorbate metabolism protein UlaG (beta-lactamase superfamily)